MKNKSILSGALCVCMLCSSAYAVNADIETASTAQTTSSALTDSAYEIEKSVTVSTLETAAAETANESAIKDAASETPSTEYTASDSSEITDSAAADSTSAETAAATDGISTDAPATLPDETAPYWTGTKATIAALESEENPGIMEFKTEDGSTLPLTISDATVCINNKLAVPTAVSDLKVGDKVYVYSTVNTDSAPFAAVIVTDLGAKEIAQLHMAERVVATNAGAEISCDHGSILVRTNSETEFKPYETRQTVTAQDLQMGKPFLAWYDTVAESLPAQASASRIVVLSTAAENQDMTAKIGDTEIAVKQVDGAFHVPARAVAEALGLTVDWTKDYDTSFVSISGDAGIMALTIGAEEYTCLPVASDAGAISKPLSAAPYYAPYQDVESATWIDAAAFEMMGYHLSVINSILCIE